MIGVWKDVQRDVLKCAAMRHPGGGIICNGAGLDATTMFRRSHAAWVGKEVNPFVALSYGFRLFLFGVLVS